MRSGSEWTDHVLVFGQGLRASEIGSWMTCVNCNVEGKRGFGRSRFTLPER